MDKGLITVVASYNSQFKTGTTSASIPAAASNESRRISDRDISSKCEEIVHQRNVALMENVFQLSEW